MCNNLKLKTENSKVKKMEALCAFIFNPKRIIFCVCALFIFAGFAFIKIDKNVFAAQGINKQINFQGKLVNSDGTNVADGLYDIVFKIYTVSTEGAAVWTESRTGGNQVQVTAGLFQVQLGSVTAFGSLVNFNTDNIYLGITVGADSEMSPRVRFASVPQAFNAEMVNGLTVTNISDLPFSSTTTLKIADGKTVVVNAGLTFSGTDSRTFTFPSSNGNIVTEDFTQTLTNKSIGDTGLIFNNATTDITTVNNENFVVTPNGTGLIGFNTTSPLASFDVRANGAGGGTVAVASLSGSTSFVTLLADNGGAGDIIAASTGGVTKFVVKNSGELYSSNYQNDGGILYTATSGLLKQTAGGSEGTCLTFTGGLPAWGACSNASNASKWVLSTTNGTLSPINNTLDFLWGSITSASANFRITGSSSLAGTKSAASVSANTSFAGFVVDNKGVGDLFTASSSGVTQFVLTNNGALGLGTSLPTAKLDVNGAASISGALKLYGIPTIQSTANQSLTLGGDTTGELVLSGRNGTDGGIRFAGYTAAGCTLKADTSGFVTCGTDNTGNSGFASPFRELSGAIVPLNSTLDSLLGGQASTSAVLKVTGQGNPFAGTQVGASISANTSFAGFVVDNTGVGDIFTASKSGATKFTILNNGNIQFAGTSNFLTTLASGATLARTLTMPTTAGDDTFCLLTAANCSDGSSNWTLTTAGGTLSPNNNTLDLLWGGTSTASADFAVLNVNGNGPAIATVSGNLIVMPKEAVGGKVGIGTINPLYPLHIVSGKDPSNYSVYLDKTISGSVTTNSASGVYSLLRNQSTGALTTSYGFSSEVFISNGGGTTSYGASYNVVNDSSFTLATAYGSYNWIRKSNSGAITNAYGVLSFIENTNVSNNIGTAYGFYSDWSNDGTINTGYGLFIEDVLATTDYGVYQEGVNDNNYFAGKVGIGTTAPLGTFDVRPNSSDGGTISIASASGSTSFAALVTNNDGLGDLFTASKSGATKFAILNNGNLQFAGQTNFLTTLASGATLSRTLTMPSTPGDDTFCLLTANNCSSGSSANFWQYNTTTGIIAPGNLTVDTLFGGTSTTSASFRVTGDNANRGTQFAASVSANTSFAGLVIDQKGSGDIFTASTSGVTQLRLTSNGALGLGLGNGAVTGQPTAKLDVNGTASISAALTFRTGAGEIQTTAGNTLSLGGSTTGRVVVPGSLGLYLGVDGSINGLLTFFSSGVGETAPTISANSTGDLTITAPSGTVIMGSGTGNINLSPGTDNIVANLTSGNFLGQKNGVNYIKLSTSGTLPTASISAQSSFASLLVDNSGVGDLFVASKSGATKFTILNNGNLQFAGQTNFLTTLASGATLSRTLTMPGTAGDDTFCLLTAANCSGGASSNWTLTEADGLLRPNNGTLDVLFGLNATNASTSAKFAILGMADDTATNNPSASVSAITGNNAGKGVALFGDGSIQSFRSNILTLGGNTTGDIQFKPNVSTTTSLSLTYSTPTYTLQPSLPSGVASNSFNLYAGDNAGLDKSGGALNLAGGRGTGSEDGGSITFSTAPSGTSGTTQNSLVERMRLTSNGLIGMGTNSPISGLQVTRPLTLSVTGKALAIFDQNENQDIFTASASGTPKFTITNAGGIKLGTDVGTGSQCLLGGTTASWGSCGGAPAGGSSNWTLSTTNGTLSPNNNTLDFLWGGASSSSANFRITGKTANAGTKSAASVSASTSFAGLVIDQVGVGDIFTASKSGATKFTVTNAGVLRAGTGNTQLTDVSGKVLHDALVDCANGEILQWATAGGWGCVTASSGSGHMALLAESTLGADASSISLSVTAKEFMNCYLTTKGNSASAVTWLRFNSDSGTNYDYQSMHITGNAVQDAQALNQAQIVLNTADTEASTHQVQISNFSDTAKSVWGRSNRADRTTGPDNFSANGTWNNTAAQITTVAFLASTGNFLSGSHAWCEGRDVADYAENYYSKDLSIEAGDVVTHDPSLPAGIKKSSKPYDPQLIGSISTKPAIVLDEGIGFGKGWQYPVALAGRIPVKVNTENGPIRSGDPLTSSSQPGVAMKATKAGAIIGQAMESFNGEGVGKVLTFVKTSYYNGSSSVDLLSDNGYSVNTDDATTQSVQVLEFLLNNKVDYAGSSLSEVMTDRVVAGLEVITPKLVAQEVDVGTIFAKDATISGTLTVGVIKANTIELSDLAWAKAFEAGGLTLDNIDAGDVTSLIATNSAVLSFDTRLNNLSDNQKSLESSMSSLSAKLERMESINLLSMPDAEGKSFVSVENFSAYGTTVLTEATIMSTLSIGNNMTFSSNSINTVGEDLEIQSLKQGSISFLDGLITFASDGKALFKEEVVFEKNVDVKGVLSAKTVNSTELQLGQGKTIVISDTEVEATAAAGLVILKKNTDHIKINNPLVRDGSFIFITPKTKTAHSLYLIDQVQGEDGQMSFFTVGSDIKAEEDIKFNYLIVN